MLQCYLGGMIKDFTKFKFIRMEYFEHAAKRLLGLPTTTDANSKHGLSMTVCYIETKYLIVINKQAHTLELWETRVFKSMLINSVARST